MTLKTADRSHGEARPLAQLAEREPKILQHILYTVERRKGYVTPARLEIEEGDDRVLSHNPKHKIFGPAATATYCFPPTSNVIGEAFIRTFVSNRHSIFPSRSSTASNPPFGFP